MSKVKEGDSGVATGNRLIPQSIFKANFPQGIFCRVLKVEGGILTVRKYYREYKGVGSLRIEYFKKLF